MKTKVLLLTEGGTGIDYNDYPTPYAVFIVPADFDPEKSYLEWDRETGYAKDIKNQHGVFKSKSSAYHTMKFHEWLASKYQSMEWIDAEL